MSETIEVQIGTESYHVAPQPVNRVFRQMASIAEGIGALGESLDTSDMEGVIVSLGEKVYDVLQAFIPDLMAKHKFLGYKTQEALENDEYDPDSYEARTSYTLPQLIDAFEAAFEINGGQRISEIVGKILGPQLRRAVQDGLVNFMADEASSLSPTSPSTNGGSVWESSFENRPTLEDTLVLSNGD